MAPRKRQGKKVTVSGKETQSRTESPESQANVIETQEVQEALRKVRHQRDWIYIYIYIYIYINHRVLGRHTGLEDT